jgi:hypothetical protein
VKDFSFVAISVKASYSSFLALPKEDGPRVLLLIERPLRRTRVPFVSQAAISPVQSVAMLLSQ